MKKIQPGIASSQDFIPDRNDTAASVGNTGVDVIATTKLILYFERQHCTTYFEKKSAFYWHSF